MTRLRPAISLQAFYALSKQTQLRFDTFYPSLAHPFTAFTATKARSRRSLSCLSLACQSGFLGTLDVSHGWSLKEKQLASCLCLALFRRGRQSAQQVWAASKISPRMGDLGTGRSRRTKRVHAKQRSFTVVSHQFHLPVIFKRCIFPGEWCFYSLQIHIFFNIAGVPSAKRCVRQTASASFLGRGFTALRRISLLRPQFRKSFSNLLLARLLAYLRAPLLSRVEHLGIWSGWRPSKKQLVGKVGRRFREASAKIRVWDSAFWVRHDCLNACAQTSLFHPPSLIGRSSFQI